MFIVIKNQVEQNCVFNIFIVRFAMRNGDANESDRRTYSTLR